MIKLMDFDTSVIKPVREEALNIVRIILKKKLTKIEDIFKYINNPKKRSRLFDSLNMMISLQGFNCEILKFLKKKNKIKNFINWTYPQIRLDGGFAKKFASPLHSDQWILDKNKNGIIVWTSLNENGSSLLIAKNKKHKIARKRTKRVLKMIRRGVSEGELMEYCHTHGIIFPDFVDASTIP